MLATNAITDNIVNDLIAKVKALNVRINPNVSPIGKSFGFECFGAGDRTRTCTAMPEEPKAGVTLVKVMN